MLPLKDILLPTLQTLYNGLSFKGLSLGLSTSGSQTFAYQAYANRTFAHRFLPITHLPIKTYAYQKLIMRSRLWPIMVGLLPIIQNKHVLKLKIFLKMKRQRKGNSMLRSSRVKQIFLLPKRTFL